jgi:hypothetical protein
MKHRSAVRLFSLLAMLGMLLSTRGIPTQSVLALPGSTALRFDGVNDYVTFGAAPGLSGLGLQKFTIELWLKRLGPGTTTSTGSGGITALPLVAKGMDEADNSNRDLNYFFGIDQTGVLVADFEECARTQAGCPQTTSNQAQGGQNFPVKGSTVLRNNTWYHAAVTFDGEYWKLYLNGALERMTGSDTGATRFPRWDSLQHAALAAALNSCGTPGAACLGAARRPGGYFNGVIDEVRIWNVARSQAEIRSTINAEVSNAPGLVTRWGLNEGPGNTTIHGVPGSIPGTLTNGPVWVLGSGSFNLVLESTPPAAPGGLQAVAASHSLALDWNDNTDPDLVGYNIYRGTVPSLYTRINTALATSSSYTDTNLANGTEYFYIVRAVDALGNESRASNEAYSIPQPAAGSALAFTSGAGSYVTFGDPMKLDLAAFTIETWFKRTGTGTPVSTGARGIAGALPLVTHCANQSEGGRADANWMLVIDDSRDVIAADFEDMPTGRNHAITGVTPILENTWHHAAATYDGATWTLYLDGKREATAAARARPRLDTAQPAALGTMLSTSGEAAGFFQGVIDEARIWNRALPQEEIVANLNRQLTSGTGLVARWGLNEGTGTSVGDSIAAPANGAITGTGYSWVPGAPFDINLAPAVPLLVSPQDAAARAPVNAPLTVYVNDYRNTDLTVSFYGRLRTAATGEDFTLVAIPDPQFYAQAENVGIYNAQMNWVTFNKGAYNIQYVLSLGDNVDGYNSSSQWVAAASAWDILTGGGVPYGIFPGNHDGAPASTANFNTWFGARIAGQPTYGGRYGGDYDNTYSLFSAGGMDFIVLFIEYDGGMLTATHPVLAWAEGILSAYPSRRAIVVTHDLLNGNNLTAQGQAIYDALKDQPGLFLMLGGHQDETGRNSFVYEGRTVYVLRSDYQFVDNWTSGYLRILRFSPANGAIYVSTYSPTQALYRTVNNNEFELAYDMGGDTPFTLIGSTTVPSGSQATITWKSLNANRAYEWYAVADNGGAATVSPTWTFTTNP